MVVSIASTKPSADQDKSIQSRFDEYSNADQIVLDRGRLCAKYTKPHILPPKEQTPDSMLPQGFQSEGPLGTTNLEGKMLLALFPPEQPWFELALDGEIQYDERIEYERKQQWSQMLWLRELLIQSLLESAGIDGGGNRRPAGFRSQMRSAIAQLLVTGDTLFQITDDYRIKVFSRNQYVTRRDSCGDVLEHAIKECIDPLSLTDEQLGMADIKREEMEDKSPLSRLTDIYTHVEWHPRSKRWVTRQEVNKKAIVEPVEEEISAFNGVPFDLVPTEHYGRGYIEPNLGTLRTLDVLMERLIHFSCLASENKTCVDRASMVRDEDLTGNPGKIIRGARVVGGEVQDIAILKANNLADFSVVNAVVERQAKNAGRAFLMESENQPRGERVTAYQIARIAMELEGAMGGLYAPVADYLQIPMIRRINYQIERDALSAPLPKEGYKVRALTGIAALGRSTSRDRLLTFAQALAAIPPQAMQFINVGVFAQVLARYNNLYEPGLVKTEEERQAEMQQAIAAQTQLAAGQKAVDVAGNVAEASMTQGAQ